MALKINICKAFDRVHQDYLLNVMEKMEFHHKWIGWMEMCLETIQYSVNINSDFVGLISPERGLRQGDPLLSYLFIICTEGLSSLVKTIESKGQRDGVKVCRRAPILSHLLFVDDYFIFCRASDIEITILKEILEIS